MKTIEEIEKQLDDMFEIIKQNNVMLMKLTARRNIPEIIIKKDYLTEEEAAIYLNTTVSYIKKLIKESESGPTVGYYQASGNNKYIARAELDRFILTSKRYLSARERRDVAARKIDQ